MALVISDEILQSIGMDEQEANIDLACRWFDAGKLGFGRAVRLAGMTELEFETQLERRGFPRYRYTEEKLAQDIEALKKLGHW